MVVVVVRSSSVFIGYALVQYTGCCCYCCGSGLQPQAFWQRTSAAAAAAVRGRAVAADGKASKMTLVDDARMSVHIHRRDAAVTALDDAINVYCSAYY